MVVMAFKRASSRDTKISGPKYGENQDIYRVSKHFPTGYLLITKEKIVTVMYQVTKVDIPSNEICGHQVSPVVMHQKRHSIALVVFLPQMLNLILREQRRNLNGGIFYK